MKLRLESEWGDEYPSMAWIAEMGICEEGDSEESARAKALAKAAEMRDALSALLVEHGR